ncbi:MAG: S8 family serine peptidase, partial [Halovenus sp.]
MLDRNDNRSELSRRDVLKATGGTLAAGAAVGQASADGRAEVNVGFDGPEGREAARRAADSIEREFNFDAMTITASQEAIDGLENNPNIRYVEENGEMQALEQSLPWGVDRVDADVLHDEGETGSGADIAIIDTGIDDGHPDLEANVGEGKAYVDCSGSNCNQPWSDDDNHGTHCAGIA